MITGFSIRPWLNRGGKQTAKMPVLLDNIGVASPCPASWAKMHGDDLVRHCQECNLNVYNLSNMTLAEAEHLIASREGRLCVRFFRRADGTILTQDCPRGLRVLIRRVSRVAGAALTAMMAVGTAFTQSAPKNGSQAASGQTAPKDSAPKDLQLTVTVFDPQGAVIAGAGVSLIDKRTGLRVSGVTDATGVGRISGLAAGDFNLHIERPGFKTHDAPITLSREKIQPLKIVLVLQVQETIGIIVETSPPVVDRDSSTVKTTFDEDLLRHLPRR